MREININRQKLCLEDLIFGVGTETQTRAGQSVVVTKINAGNLPFDETKSLLEWAKSVNLEELGNMSAELQALYDNLPMLGNVEDNLTMLNAIEDSLTMLNSIYTNISKIQNVDTNMQKLQNIDTHMAELSAIYTNLAMLQAVYNNLTMLNNVEDNLTAINSVNSNLTKLLAIHTQVIPNLTELLQVNENAAQVAADKITVNSDKLIVAQDKADVSVMKSAVESIYDSFDDRFLGAKSTDPTVDNDGDPLVDGALYFNSSSYALKVYSLTDTTWYTIPQIYLSGLLDVQLTSITTGDILNWNGIKWANTRTPKFSTMQLTGGTGIEGTLSWNLDEGTADLDLPGGSTLQIGQENIRTVRNNTGSTISNGRLCMFDGTIGNSGRIKVKPFTAGFNEAMYLYGVATQNIISGSDGIITIEGKVRGIDTTGSSVGEVWADEDILYAKPSGNGMMTNIEPADNELKLVVATVIKAHTSGTLEIRFMPFNENMYYTKVQNDILLASKVEKVASTNNAIVRFDGTTGAVQNSSVIIDDNGNINIGNGPSLSNLTINNNSGGEIAIGSNTSFDRAWRIKSNLYDGTNGYPLTIGYQSNVFFKISPLGSLTITSPTGGIGYGAGAGGAVTQLTSKNTAVTLNKPSGTITMNNASLAAGASVSFTFNNSLIQDNDLLVVSNKTWAAYDVECVQISTGSASIEVTNKGSTASQAVPVVFILFKGANS